MVNPFFLCAALDYLKGAVLRIADLKKKEIKKSLAVCL